MPEKLVYIGKITKTEPIEGADRIHLATAVCGSGGIWRGVIRIDEGSVGQTVKVFLPDAVLPSDDPEYVFMSPHRWRVKQRRFKGMPSEALIMPISGDLGLFCVGDDVTDITRVVKYDKPGLLHLPLEALGDFPDFLPKTDEPNFQRVPSMFNRLRGHTYYATMKMDGCSSTAFKHKGEFGVCSRNLQIKDGPNPIWDVVRKYDLERRLPEGYAVQWETCGPKLQNNPIGLKENDGWAFNLWRIATSSYLDFSEFSALIDDIMQRVPVLPTPTFFEWEPDALQKYVETLTYPNGKPAEGIVVRPKTEIREMFHHEMMRLSFKVINLKYKD